MEWKDGGVREFKSSSPGSVPSLLGDDGRAPYPSEHGASPVKWDEGHLLVGFVSFLGGGGC